MRYHIYIAIPVLMAFISCSKKSADTPPAMVPERISISPANKSVKQGDTAIFTITYFNTLGIQSPTPAGISWSVNNGTVASVTQTGVATGLAIGQAEIKATYNAAVSTALLSVVQNDQQIATISIEPMAELTLTGTQTLSAVAKNINGVVLTGKTFTWQTDDASLVSVDATGKITANGYGTTQVRAAAEGISSNNCMAQVIRKGIFMGMGSAGTGKLKISNGVLVLQTSADFSVNTAAPDLRIYLSNNSGNVTDAVEVATLSQRNGAQSWNVPAGTSITKYKYMVVWCKQFGGAYGVAELSN